jgi:L-lactate dehydrogenase (cytochrome)
MRDVSDIETCTRMFGQEVALPLGLGPVGLAGLCARRGEVQAARAAEKAGVPFCLSTVAVCDVGEVARGHDRAFLVPALHDPRSSVHGGYAAAGGAALFGAGLHGRHARGGHAVSRFPFGHVGRPGAARRCCAAGFTAAQRPGWAWDIGIRGRPHSIGNLASVLGRRAGAQDFAAWIMRNFDPSVTWDDLDFVRAHWKGPLVIKGVLDPEDAEAAVAAGADGIVVSNHGGRQLDGALASAEALPAIAARVKGRTAILADGGVRSGVDLLKMLALGADGVLLGRAWAYALAADGEAGVTALLEGFGRDLRAAMAMTGCRTLADIGPEILVRPQEFQS